ncbi:MAG: alpha-amylase/4-alpha-glucanotransferase domain-containing protein [Candidatus Omnitrophota bacterium]
MNNAYLAMGLHFHQPVGNFEKIIDRAYNNCYRPFLEAVSSYPDIKMSFHISGNLLDYFEENKPEFLDKVKLLVDRKQVEIIGGGYFEPIFQAIPGVDRIEQLNMLRDHSLSRFDTKPNGAWIPERVWSPEIAKELLDADIRYIILDDTHLVKSGIKKKDLFGYFRHKDNGRSLAIFPSDKRLRYLIPFQEPKKTIEYMKLHLDPKDEVIFTYGDDVEKFGEWPYTHDLVYDKGWLKNFFELLIGSSDWLRTVTFSECMDIVPSKKTIKVKEASYEEMAEWSGGSWMNFLDKYSESNQMHKRMLYMSEKINKIKTDPLGPSQLLQKAKTELYKSQCNCGYWHGVFGGIYLNHLRTAIYEHLIKSDTICDEIIYKNDPRKIDIKKVDFYKNKKDVAILEDNDFFIVVDPEKGGVVRELDYKKRSVNLINTMSRYKEPYHKKILKRLGKSKSDPSNAKMIDKDIKDIVYDRYKRVSFLDHFIKEDATLDDIISLDYKDISDLPNKAYRCAIEKDRLVLTRNSKIGRGSIELVKSITIESSLSIKVSYTLKNTGRYPIKSLFGVEMNVCLPYADSNWYSYRAGDDYIGSLNKKGIVEKNNIFSIDDSTNELGLEFRFQKSPSKMYYFPIKTVSQSESSYDLNYQGSCIFPVWELGLRSGEALGLDISWVII